ncbi:ASPIC and UnbV [Thalassoglobus neptunius]|uniref:ASPIC and UnbV n=1 Tax=Thalassoglobus neptunius TaxID=1938619 RepID=A0A5C5V8X8_9PLAN|nr:CRTAC1 family protein [Thalassoglobus neptunius]TWT35046.1 ASPIC and UnbV [Thalassoglobus neptunius]
MQESEKYEDGYDPDQDEQNDAVVGVALKWSLAVLVVLGGVVGGTVWWLNRPKVVEVSEPTELADVQIRESEDVDIPQIPFTDITDAASIGFVHENGAAGQKLLPETMGGGCAFFDFDNDGDQDLLLVNSQTWEEFAGESESSESTLALYRNDGKGNFEDVTEGSGLDVTLYGMGVACGDYDGDGLVDLYITAVGPNRLFHNEGNGKFADVTSSAGVAGGKQDWGTSCGWFDYDHDGDLDLFVCNYVTWSKEYDLAQDFKLTGGDRAYGRPQNFEGAFPYLFRNDQNGKFTDVTESAGLEIRNSATNVPVAKSLGVTFDDFDSDGWLDIIVANDTVQNLLFRNNQDGTFREVGAISGVAFDMNGMARGAMGIDSAPFRNNDSIGIAIGNFSNEMTALYVSSGQSMQFVDEAIASGLGPSTRLSLTFGVFFFDADLDGRVDLFTANGHLEEDINRVQPSQFYKQSPQLFWNCGPRFQTEFLLLSDSSVGEDFSAPLVGRGASYADIDGDGDLDILIMATGDKPRLLRNDQLTRNHWLRFDLEGDGSNPHAIGAEIRVEFGDEVRFGKIMPTRSYLSQVELPETIGLGNATAVDRVAIYWPDGTVQDIGAVDVDRVHRVRKSNLQTALVNERS